MKKFYLLKQLLVLACFALFSQLCVANDVTNDQRNEKISLAVQAAMEKLQVPGIAVAVVKDNQVVMAKGFGVTKYGSKQKVNADTLFGIASNTKAMTAAILAGLVDEGKLSWQTKIIDIIPEFQLYDAWVTREFTVLDLLSHNSGLGLGAGDLMIWPQTSLTTMDIIKRMKFLRPVSSFRSEFAYDNLMYIIAGQIIAKITDKPWQQVIQERIFTPLHMKNTRAKFSLIEKSNHNVARAHVPLDGKINVVGGNFLEKFSSAGAVASSVNDMSQWLKLQLNHGVISSQTRENNKKEIRLFSEQQSRKMWRPKTLLGVSKSATINDKTHFNAYGLGWFLSDFHGYKMAHHSGGILGMVSKVVLIPEENLGLVILTNQQSGYAFNALYREILMNYLDLPQRDWVSYYADLHSKRLTKEKTRLAKQQGSIAKNSTPSLALSAYAGTYKDAWYGNINITEKQGKLVMQFSNTKALVGELEHYQYNTFIVHWYDRTLEADAYVNFNLTVEGKIANATMNAVSNLTDFSFDFQDLLLKPVTDK
ncbi:MAG: serine hydrolase [Gammaproteobacteria bacterium]|nr:MAG: serine hydrolase [Gammaproteobacteria bacterium]